MDKHEVICLLKDAAIGLGRTPTRDEFRAMCSEKKMRKLFGTFSALVQASGLDAVKASKDKDTKFKYKKTLIDSFHIHEIDLADLFKKAGNPKVLKVLGMPDTHVEHRDHAAVNCFLEFAEFYNPDVVLMYGDFLDAEGISHWVPNTLKPRDFISEVIEARELLDVLVRKTPKAIYRPYLFANHEDWINQAMVQKLPEFFNGLEKLGLMPDLNKLLDLEKFGIDLIPLNHFLKIGNTFHTHGLYTGNGHPKKHLDTVKNNIYYGHLHDMQSYHSPTVNGMIEAACSGHLSKNDAAFLKGKPNNWQQGFTIMEFFTDGSYSRYPLKINNGRLSFMGKVFGG